MSFGFSSIGHFFASAVHDIVIVAKGIERAAPKVMGTEPVIEGITGLIDPQAVILERMAYGILGHVFGAVHTADEAATAGGFNFTLDAQEVAEIRAILAALIPLTSQANQLFPNGKAASFLLTSTGGTGGTGTHQPPPPAPPVTNLG